jgi:hypothetical protein
VACESGDDDLSEGDELEEAYDDHGAHTIDSTFQRQCLQPCRRLGQDPDEGFVTGGVGRIWESALAVVGLEVRVGFWLEGNRQEEAMVGGM